MALLQASFTAIFGYLALFDAAVVLFGGVTLSLLFLVGKKEWVDQLIERVWPALLTLIGSTLASGLILWVAGRFI